MSRRRARPVALAIVRRDERILVFEAVDPVKDETFYRPLGGGIEFGELGASAVARELGEEIGAVARNVELIGVLENVFEYAGRAEHEILLLYDVTLDDGALPDERFEGVEANGTPLPCVWKALADFGPRGARLYPEGLFELLTAGPRAAPGLHGGGAKGG